MKRVLEEQEHVAEVSDAMAWSGGTDAAPRVHTAARCGVQVQGLRAAASRTALVHALPGCAPHAQASVNLATETALVKVLVPKGHAAQDMLALGERLAQVRARLVLVVCGAWGGGGLGDGGGRGRMQRGELARAARERRGQAKERWLGVALVLGPH